MNRKTMLTALGSFALIAGSAQADLVVTNGDFSADGHVTPGDGPQTITDWFDSTENFSSWNFVEAGGTESAAALGAGGGASEGWIYQSPGNYNAANGSTLNWSLTVQNSALSNNSTFDIEFFTGAFAGADGTDLVGLTSLGADTFTDSGNGTYDETAASGSIDLSGLGDGSEVWIRIANTAFDSVDDVSVEVVPEPSSLSLLGLGGLVMLRRRRK